MVCWRCVTIINLVISADCAYNQSLELRGNKPCVAPPCLTQNARWTIAITSTRQKDARLPSREIKIGFRMSARPSVIDSTVSHQITKCEKQRALLPCFHYNLPKEGKPCPFSHRGQIGGSNNHCNTALFSQFAFKP